MAIKVLLFKIFISNWLTELTKVHPSFFLTQTLKRDLISLCSLVRLVGIVKFKVQLLPEISIGQTEEVTPTKAGLESARARGKKGGRKFVLTKAQVRLAQAAMSNEETVVSELCKELGVTRATLYRYVSPNGELRNHAKVLLCQ
ncbi:transposase (resolvase, DNA invertase) [Legionella sainthelensi]|uniref:Transposase (Resolvase, DNA invertase) n=1 Tax=Legionella sainthelensi TaxID=28087 RepID=A0A0W0YNL3_9GAMM|nr:transposase (resolvase, DNA invertase) [Legionella sainthelensi]VEH33926.1 transposase (resolvase, DNA invertase) [Legionella sainthelensi]